MKESGRGKIWLLPVLFWVALCGLLLYFSVTGNVDHVSLRTEPGLQELSYEVWQEPDPDSPIGLTREYHIQLEEDPDRGDCLAFYTVHQYVEVYIGQELVSQWKPREGSFVKTVGSNWTLVPLTREDAGKEVRVRLMPVYESVKDREVTFWEGPAIHVYSHQLKSDLPELMISGIALVMGLVFLVLSLIPGLRKYMGRRLVYLGVFAIWLGLWRVNDTRFSPFMMPEKPILMFYSTLGALMSGVVPLLLMLEEQLTGRMRKITRLYIRAVSLLGLAELGAQVFLGIDLRQFLTCTMLCLILGMVVLVAGLVKLGERNPSVRNLSVFSLVLSVGALADISRYYRNSSSAGLVFTLSAVLLCVALLGVQMVIHYVRRERELQDSQTKIMLSQIQPHFLYNALCVIQDLCHGAAPEAEKATVEFSEFLRSNLDSLRATDPIPFTAELKHTRNYLSLEQRRFGDDLQVVYDIETMDFSLPALTLEPIVENAVRYGVLQREDGGTVWISTKEEQDAYRVTVRDDGVGFDVTVTKQDGRSHIGIQNVRDRLERMCGGSLVIVSTPGKGTVATITVPKGRKAE